MDVERIKSKIKNMLWSSPDIYACLDVDKSWAFELTKKFEDEISSTIAASASVGKAETLIDVRQLIDKYLDQCDSIDKIIVFFYILGYIKARVEAYSVMQPVYTYCREFIRETESKTRDMQRYFFGYHG